MANKWTKTTINIPRVYTPVERVAIAQDVIDYIVERTKAGKGPGNKAWMGKSGEYSKAYQKSVEFRASGKSKNVNLKLSGDMLDAIGIITDKAGAVTIGITDDDQVGKAEGNIRGTYGKNTPIRGKSRPFLNLTNDELKKILQNYPLNDRVKSRAEAEAIVSTSDMAQEYLDE
jgi:hypothetical protein